MMGKNNGHQVSEAATPEELVAQHTETLVEILDTVRLLRLSQTTLESIESEMRQRQMYPPASGCTALWAGIDRLQWFLDHHRPELTGAPAQPTTAEVMLKEARGDLERAQKLFNEAQQRAQATARGGSGSESYKEAARLLGMRADALRAARQRLLNALTNGQQDTNIMRERLELQDMVADGERVELHL